MQMLFWGCSCGAIGDSQIMQVGVFIGTRCLHSRHGAIWRKSHITVMSRTIMGSLRQLQAPLHKLGALTYAHTCHHLRFQDWYCFLTQANKTIYFFIVFLIRIHGTWRNLWVILPMVNGLWLIWRISLGPVLKVLSTTKQLEQNFQMEVGLSNRFASTDCVTCRGCCSLQGWCVDCYDVLLTCVPSGSGKRWTGTGGIRDPHFWQKWAKGSDRRGAEQCAHLEIRANRLSLF